MSRSSTNGSSLRCSFCSKSQSEVRKLIAGPNVYICDECIEICTDIIDEERDLEEREGQVSDLNQRLITVESRLAETRRRGESLEESLEKTAAKYGVVREELQARAEKAGHLALRLRDLRRNWGVRLLKRFGALQDPD